MSAFFKTVRIIAFCIASLFALIVLGLASHVISLTLNLGGYFEFAALAIATAVLTLLTLPVILIIDTIRTGAVSSWVIVELIWIFILWVLWLSAGADAAYVYSNSVFVGGCNFRSSAVTSICREIPGITAFSFIIWFILMAYWIALLVFAVQGASRGHNVWTSSVKQGDFLSPTPAAPVAQPNPGGSAPLAQPQPQMFQQYPVSSSPPIQTYPSPAPYGGVVPEQGAIGGYPAQLPPGPGGPGYYQQPGGTGYPPSPGYPPQHPQPQHPGYSTSPPPHTIPVGGQGPYPQV